MISVQQLTKRFGGQIAVSELSFEIPAGQIVGFLGPNGAGKSTTLKMLTGMLAPTSGTATICGFDLQRETIQVKRNVGFVPESGAVFESLTGLEYLEMVAALYAIPVEAARAPARTPAAPERGGAGLTDCASGWPRAAVPRVLLAFMGGLRCLYCRPAYPTGW